MVSMIIAALLCAIGIVIPMFCPKIVIGPASFTLASHVPIFIAMFISPPVAIIVSLGTTLGFFMAGFPLVIVLRALTHVIFATIGAFLLKKNPRLISGTVTTTLFGLGLGVIHAACEVLVVTYFFFGGQMSKSFYTNGYIMSVLLLIGLGGLVHSMVDYGISLAVWKPLTHAVLKPKSISE